MFVPNHSSGKWQHCFADVQSAVLCSSVAVTTYARTAWPTRCATIVIGCQPHVTGWGVQCSSHVPCVEAIQHVPRSGRHPHEKRSKKSWYADVLDSAWFAYSGAEQELLKPVPLPIETRVGWRKALDRPQFQRVKCFPQKVCTDKSSGCIWSATGHTDVLVGNGCNGRFRCGGSQIMSCRRWSLGTSFAVTTASRQPIQAGSGRRVSLHRPGSFVQVG